MVCLNKPHHLKFLKAVLNLTWSIFEYIVWYMMERFEKIVNGKQFSTKKNFFHRCLTGYTVLVAAHFKESYFKCCFYSD